MKLSDNDKRIIREDIEYLKILIGICKEDGKQDRATEYEKEIERLKEQLRKNK